jgi:hypothetical protein
MANPPNTILGITDPHLLSQYPEIEPFVVPFWDYVVENANGLPIKDANGNYYAPGYSVDYQAINALNAWNRFQVNGIFLAGITINVKVRTKRGHKANTNPQKDKANPIIFGVQPASFEIEQYIWDPNQLHELTQQLQTLWVSNIGKTLVSPYSVTYPSLNQIGIYNAYIISIGALEAHNNGRVLKIEFLEWYLPTDKPAVSKQKKTASVETLSTSPPPVQNSSEPNFSTPTGDDQVPVSGQQTTSTPGTTNSVSPNGVSSGTQSRVNAQ